MSIQRPLQWNEFQRWMLALLLSQPGIWLAAIVLVDYVWPGIASDWRSWLAATALISLSLCYAMDLWRSLPSKDDKKP